MVISDLHPFLFVRIPKNASTSLATFFVENYCGPNSINTGIGDSRIKPSNVPASVIEKHKTQYRIIHLTLNEIIEERLITEEDARSRRVIGVIRNPLERQLSLFFFKNRSNKRGATPEAFRKDMQNGYMEKDGSNHILQTDYLKIGEENVGEFWKYDNLDMHLDRFSEEYGQPKFPIKSFKSNIKPDSENLISDYYDDATRKAVEEYFMKDFEEYENR